MYPVYLKLFRKPVLVVGAGKIAARKIRTLVSAGADVSVVAPRIDPSLEEMAKANQIILTRREFRRSDTKGQYMIISATNDTAVNAYVHTSAVKRNILVNSVDDPEHCEFYIPAVIKRGPLQVSIGTSGHSPLFAKRLKSFLEERLDNTLGAQLEDLGRLRKKLIAENQHLTQDERGKIISSWQHDAIEALIKRIASE